MAYVAVKGGERAIDNAHAWLAEARRGNPDVPDLALDQIQQQMGRAVDRVMAEGSLYDPELAALAIKQAQGDLIEAAFLLRAYRTTLPRFGYAEPVDTGAMQIRRRISAVFKDLPGGQILGPTYDYTHRLLDFALAALFCVLTVEQWRARKSSSALWVALVAYALAWAISAPHAMVIAMALSVACGVLMPSMGKAETGESRHE